MVFLQLQMISLCVKHKGGPALPSNNRLARKNVFFCVSRKWNPLEINGSDFFVTGMNRRRSIPEA